MSMVADGLSSRMVATYSHDTVVLNCGFGCSALRFWGVKFRAFQSVQEQQKSTAQVSVCLNALTALKPLVGAARLLGLSCAALKPCWWMQTERGCWILNKGDSVVSGKDFRLRYPWRKPCVRSCGVSCMSRAIWVVCRMSFGLAGG